MSKRRLIVNRYYFRSINHPISARPSVVVTFECGHTKRYKGSQEPKGNYAFCKECNEIGGRSR